jgi:hypothetical protein
VSQLIICIDFLRSEDYYINSSVHQSPSSRGTAQDLP